MITLEQLREKIRQATKREAVLRNKCIAIQGKILDAVSANDDFALVNLKYEQKNLVNQRDLYSHEIATLIECLGDDPLEAPEGE